MYFVTRETWKSFQKTQSDNCKVFRQRQKCSCRQFEWHRSKYQLDVFNMTVCAVLAQLLQDPTGSWCEKTFNAPCPLTSYWCVRYCTASCLITPCSSLTKPVLKTPTSLDQSQLGFFQTIWYSIIAAVDSLAAGMTLTPEWEPTVHHQQCCFTLDARSWSCALFILLTAQTVCFYSPAVYCKSKQSSTHLKASTGSETRKGAVPFVLCCDV